MYLFSDRHNSAFRASVCRSELLNHRCGDTSASQLWKRLSQSSTYLSSKDITLFFDLRTIMSHILASTMPRHTNEGIKQLRIVLNVSDVLSRSRLWSPTLVTMEMTCSPVTNLLPSHKPRPPPNVCSCHFPDSHRDFAQDTLTELEHDARLRSL